MIHVEVSDAFQSIDFSQMFENSIQSVFELLDLPFEGDLSIVIGTDEELQKLNQQFANMDAPTDVLSFTSGEIDPETGRLYYGDIIISYPRAAVQAETAGHPVNAEIQLLVIHGMLHLLEYDHQSPEEKSIMWSIQEKILRKSGTGIIKYPD